MIGSESITFTFTKHSVIASQLYLCFVSPTSVPQLIHIKGIYFVRKGVPSGVRPPLQGGEAVFPYSSIEYSNFPYKFPG
jgi:hypothetical protein